MIFSLVFVVCVYVYQCEHTKVTLFVRLGYIMTDSRLLIYLGLSLLMKGSVVGV